MSNKNENMESFMQIKVIKEHSLCLNLQIINSLKRKDFASSVDFSQKDVTTASFTEEHLSWTAAFGMK